jgi:hypothetical protein
MIRAEVRTGGVCARRKCSSKRISRPSPGRAIHAARAIRARPAAPEEAGIAVRPRGESTRTPKRAATLLPGRGGKSARRTLAAEVAAEVSAPTALESATAVESAAAPAAVGTPTSM